MRKLIRVKEKKEEIWLSPMTKAPTPAEISKGQSDNTNNATKKFDYTAVADRLRTVGWSNYGHPTIWRQIDGVLSEKPKNTHNLTSLFFNGCLGRKFKKLLEWLTGQFFDCSPSNIVTVYNYTIMLAVNVGHWECNGVTWICYYANSFRWYQFATWPKKKPQFELLLYFTCCDGKLNRSTAKCHCNALTKYHTISKKDNWQTQYFST